MPDLSDRLRTLDSHSFVSKEFRVYTLQGAILSIVTLSSIFYLLWTEMRYNFQTIITERVHVNGTSSRGLEVDFDITLPNIPCNLLSIDANDPTGQTQSLHLDKSHHVWKHRVKVDELTGALEFRGRRAKLEPGSTFLEEEHFKTALNEMEVKFNEDDESSDEEECGSCYGAGEEDECCNTCEDVKRTYQKKGWQLKDIKNVKQCQHEVKKGNEEGEGCNVHGLVALDSGGGNFHLAPSREMTDAISDESGGAKDMNEWFNTMIHRAFENWNVTHTMHHIRFGDSYPGHVHQLDGKTRAITDGHGMYQYYFKIVPTRYIFLNGTTIQTNQYSVTEHLRHVNPGSSRGLPGIFFFYEVSPLHVEIVEGYRKGWVAFFTSVCAIIGGVVTTMGMLDQFLYSRRGASSTNGLVL
ncbi:unnamed protein product [Cylindrotheca closterium]|uniref:Endoplasmic reticulum-Golgi intermediate compartment protein 3 n=1 Tax=Cylindrotheca closterium TaxID=2856 RepID=A0AAD2CCT8_9STRA|nr:unnamed protein product [Cylindrotheca closterium]